MTPFDDLKDALARHAAEGLARRARPIDSPPGPRITVDGVVDALNFASNDYLGLAAHPALKAAAVSAIQAFGTGAAAARLIAGSYPQHRQLERALAEHLGMPDVLVFNSGYHANLAVISTLAGPEDFICSDALNHASLIDGCRLARARVAVIPHGDLHALERALVAAPPGTRRKLVVSESVFSMDGDTADVAALRTIADRHGAALILDEAHAFGVLGPEGRGVAAAQRVQPDVLTATLGKAIGAYGAFAAGPSHVIEWLRNRARPFIFSTALPPAVLAAAEAGLGETQGARGANRRQTLLERVRQLADALRTRGRLAPGAGHTPILPIVVGDPGRTMAASDALLQRHGVFVQGVRPPTVPPDGSRLRIAVMASHTAADIDALVAALDEVLPT